MSKNRPPKHIRERWIKRCRNKFCKVILKDDIDIRNGYCHNCMKKRRNKKL
jgi:hypothetical protein